MTAQERHIAVLEAALQRVVDTHRRTRRELQLRKKREQSLEGVLHDLLELLVTHDLEVQELPTPIQDAMLRAIEAREERYPLAFGRARAGVVLVREIEA